MSVETLKFMDVTLNLKDIKKALKKIDFKDDRLKIYIKLLSEQIRTDEIYNPDGTFRNDWTKGKFLIKNFISLLINNDYLIATQSIHTPYTIKAHYKHSQNRNLTFKNI